jgi:predicted amidohydrolase
MRIAAYQMPLAATQGRDALPLIEDCVRRCEREGVDLLLCPEAALGGLADDVASPADIAIGVANGDLETLLRPLSSSRVTTVLGFTEVDGECLYNSAVVFSLGAVGGIYRKRHPARRTSVYAAGAASPVFVHRSCRFGIMICNDTNHPALAREMAAGGATLIVVPSNNALRPAYANVVDETRTVDILNAKANAVALARADVAGDIGRRRARGSSSIIDPMGEVICAAQLDQEDLLIADL